MCGFDQLHVLLLRSSCVAFLYIFIYMHIHEYTHAYTCVYMCIYIYICIYICICICIYMYVYTCIYIYTNVLNSTWWHKKNSSICVTWLNCHRMHLQYETTRAHVRHDPLTSVTQLIFRNALAACPQRWTYNARRFGLYVCRVCVGVERCGRGDRKAFACEDVQKCLDTPYICIHL